MSDSGSSPVRYRVSYSELVRADLIRLAARASAASLSSQFLAAIKEIDYRLRVYPQFGQPLFDLKLESAQVWTGVVPPLVAKYSIDEERRLVMVTTPFVTFSRSGF
jgi:hypothetical protein